MKNFRTLLSSSPLKQRSWQEWEQWNDGNRFRRWYRSQFASPSTAATTASDAGQIWKTKISSVTLELWFLSILESLMVRFIHNMLNGVVTRSNASWLHSKHDGNGLALLNSLNLQTTLPHPQIYQSGIEDRHCRGNRPSDPLIPYLFRTLVAWHLPFTLANFLAQLASAGTFITG